MLSRRAQRTGAPPISWLMQQAVEVPGLVSLAAGLVDRESLPAARCAQLYADLLADPEAARDALQYGTTAGYRSLREALAERYFHGTAYADPDALVVTAGGQQAIELIGEAILDPDDLVIVEAPTYFVFTGCLQSFGAHAIGVPCDEEGMRIDALAETLAELRRTGDIERLKAIYVVGYCQNPGGWTLAAGRRQQLAALMADLPEQVVVIEDAAYYELVFDVASRPPLLAGLDPSGRRVATVLTADKPFAPGFKLGWCALPPGLREAVINLKGNHDFGSSNLSQHLIARALASGAFDAQVHDLRARYRRKAGILASALAEALPAGAVDWVVPDGGLYLWARLPGIDTGPEGAFFKACLEQKVLSVPGSYAYPAGVEAPRDRIRLTYAVPTEDELREGARRLAAAWRSIV